MKIYYTDHYTLNLPEDHRFPADKYRLLREKLLKEGVVKKDDLRIPRAATSGEICRAHDPEYVGRFERGELTEKELRRIGLPWSPDLVVRAKRSVGATIKACFSAVKDGIAVSLSGGTHHAFRDRGEGYCILNDSVIASRAVQSDNQVRQVLIVDCDVHQGNGTAAMVAGDQSIFTFSIHGKNNFPLHKEKSDLDIALSDGAGDQEYLSSLNGGLKDAFGQARADLVIFLAGADPFRRDRYSRLNLTKEGLAERDRMVFGYSKKQGTPVAVTMAGGYGRDIQDTVDIHFQTVKTAVEWAKELE